MSEDRRVNDLKFRDKMIGFAAKFEAHMEHDTRWKEEFVERFNKIDESIGDIHGRISGTIAGVNLKEMDGTVKEHSRTLTWLKGGVASFGIMWGVFLAWLKYGK
jgi:hypothetical protein